MSEPSKGKTIARSALTLWLFTFLVAFVASHMACEDRTFEDPAYLMFNVFVALIVSIVGAIVGAAIGLLESSD